MQTLKAYDDRAAAIRQARVEQGNVERSVLVGVERDIWKAPYHYRVVAFDLNSERDRGMLGPVHTERLTGVVRVMFARRLTLIMSSPRPADVIGEYRAKRKAKRTAKAAA